jgi:hypothetical protein
MTIEWRNQFILAANERARSINVELSTIKSSYYNSLLDTIETYHTKDSKTLANKLTLTRYLDKKLKTLADEIVFSSFSHPIKDNILANELNYTTYVKLIDFIKH